MARAQRRSESGWFHVMNRGVNGAPIVTDDVDRAMFVSAIGRAAARSQAEVHAFCVMTNHFHLLVRAEGTDLATFMKVQSQSYVRRFNDRHHRFGPVFAGRYHHVPITTDEQLVTVLRYIVLNPLAIDRFDIERYPWSSHPAFLGGDAPPWLQLTLLDRFDGVDDYRNFVDSGRANAEVVVETIRIACDEWAAGRGSRKSDVRDAALLVADQVEEPLATELIRALGFPTPVAARVAKHRARARALVLTPITHRVLATMSGAVGNGSPFPEAT